MGQKIIRIIVACCCLLSGAAVVFFYTASPPRASGTETLFVIPPHTTTAETLALLKQKGFIRNAKIFGLLLKLHGEKSIQPGGYMLSNAWSAWQLALAFYGPTHKWVQLKGNMNNEEIAEEIARTLAWRPDEQERFRVTHAAMLWDYFNEDVLEIFSQLFLWDTVEREKFSAMAALFKIPELDFFDGVYVPDNYLVSITEGQSSIVEKLLGRIKMAHAAKKTFFEEHFDRAAATAARDFVRSQIELRPDIIPLPASELSIQKNGAKLELIFDTTYWNEGLGPLELAADQSTRHIEGDVERDIYQRIYRIDGTYRDELAGNFFWHDTHLHYHYRDFVDYELVPIGTSAVVPETRKKSTFCVRDITRIDVQIRNAAPQAAYTICGKQRQGISVGWGDTYFHTYPDQNLNITGLPEGLYRLTFTVNPKDLFKELRTDNNTAHVIMHIDPEERLVEVVDEITSSEIPSQPRDFIRPTNNKRP